MLPIQPTGSRSTGVRRQCRTERLRRAPSRTAAAAANAIGATSTTIQRTTGARVPTDTALEALGASITSKPEEAVCPEATSSIITIIISILTMRGQAGTTRRRSLRIQALPGSTPQGLAPQPAECSPRRLRMPLRAG